MTRIVQTLAVVFLALIPLGTRAETRVPESLADIQLTFAPVVDRAAPAVVNIYATRMVAERASPFFDDPFFQDLFRDFGRTRPREQNSLGSGVIVGGGLVVSNFHVVGNATDIRVVLADRREFAGTLVMADEEADLAVIRIEDADDLPSLDLADSDALSVGDLVLAIGNPFGIGQTVTSGIISALDRSDGQGATAYIQTDAAINQGNSGGALVDMDGDLIGINTMILSPSGTSAGVGFAVPSAMVRRVVESAAGGETAVTRAWLGASVSPMTSNEANRIGMDRPRGVIVNSVYRGSPAATAGVREGDVITAVGGQGVDDAAALNFRIGVVRPGEQVELTVFRDGSERTLRARVEAPPGDATPQTVTIGGRNPFTGAAVADLTPALADQIGADPMAGGVILTGVSGRSYAAAAGFRPGDIVRSLNGQEITSTRQLQQLIEGTERGWDIVILRNGQEVRGRF
jgi:Do/DeqQ family serine protease